MSDYEDDTAPYNGEEPNAEAYRDADEIIKDLTAQGHGDYSKHRRAIAQLWDGPGGLWYGNNEASTDLEDPELKDLRLIQEDHYDQHMEDETGEEDEDGEPIRIPHDDKPDWDDMIGSYGDYLFFA